MRVRVRESAQTGEAIGKREEGSPLSGEPSTELDPGPSDHDLSQMW